MLQNFFLEAKVIMQDDKDHTANIIQNWKEEHKSFVDHIAEISK